MAAPTLFAAGDLFAERTGNSITPVIPIGTVNNDVGVMACMCNGSSTFTTPTDWNVLGTAVDSANQSTAWFWKRLTGSDSDPTSTTSASGSNSVGLYGRIYVFRGCLTTGTPFEGVTNNGIPTSSTTPVSGQVTTTDSDRRVCSLVLVDNDSVWSSGMPPAGWANMGERQISTVGGDCMSDGISRSVPTATTISGATLGTMSANDFWRTLTFALLPEAGGPVLGSADGTFLFEGNAAGGRIPQPHAPETRAPIPAVLMVTTPGDWNVHPYYKLPVTPANWGNSTDMATIDTALEAYPNRTRVVLIAEDDGTADGRCVAALNWALRHYEEVQSISLRAPIIDIEERHDRVGGAEATSIEDAYGGGGHAVFPGTSGAYASTPDHASLDIVGDIDIRADVAMTDWTPAANQALVSKWWASGGNHRSYTFQIQTDGKLRLVWTADGVTQLAMVSTVAPTVTNGDRLAVRVTLDVDNGASQRVATFYTAPSIDGTWTQLGSTVTTAGATSIHSGTAPLEVGSTFAGTATLLVGDGYAAEVRTGIGGTVVADPDFRVQSSGTTSFADSTGKTWTMNDTTSIVSGFETQMMEWNPGANHRLHMLRDLYNTRLHIWRDDADTVTPAAVTDTIAATTKATLHTTLGTTADVTPDTQEWVNQKAFEQMRILHDYARTSPSGAFKTADGAQTVVLPDGRWVSLCSDTAVLPIDDDDTWGTAGPGIVRNSILIHDSFGNITGQVYSEGINTVALLADQDEYPGGYYWPLGGCMESGLLNITCDLQPAGAGFGTPLDRHIVRMDPDTLTVDSIISLGDVELRTKTLIVDTDSGFIYGVVIQPSLLWRVPVGSLHDLASYRYWDGATWNTDKGQISPVLRNLPGGGTTTLAGRYAPSEPDFEGGDWDIRRWHGGWLALGLHYVDRHIAVYYSDVPQGPYTLYTHVPIPQVGDDYYGTYLYAYFPFWHPERDVTPTRLMIGYSTIGFGSDVPADEADFIHLSPHFVCVDMHRDPFA